MSRQSAKTKASIHEAFVELVFSKRYDEIRMTDIAAVANVGRSTLYQHYPDKDAILLANMDWVLNGLLQTTDGPSAENQVTTVLDHIWQHRPQARRLLFGTTGEKLEAALAGAVARKLHQDRPDALPAVFTANQVAAAVFSALRTWLRGEGSCSPLSLASGLCRTSSALTGHR
ncbi:TetR/AcrR family transcriptional regulator [Roseibium salinum]|uniref:TetR/AcrR family transcriptional regulator n=1 Tax=Roseibium salinum TaxID=1604349 RepID=UPI0035EEC80F